MVQQDGGTYLEGEMQILFVHLEEGKDKMRHEITGCEGGRPESQARNDFLEVPQHCSGLEREEAVVDGDTGVIAFSQQVTECNLVVRQLQ